MGKKEKVRLDICVQQKYSHLSRTQIKNFILDGSVTVDGKKVTKPGVLVLPESSIELLVSEPTYVSRAGLKLEAALKVFKLDVKDLVVLDAGISTGGFTDCLLQHGVKHVYGVDVGQGQVHEKIAQDKRVTVLEKTNLRYLKVLPVKHTGEEKVDLVTLDLSFISVLKVIPAIKKLLKPDGRIIILIKPQFEVDKKDIGRGGIIKDSKVHDKAIERVKLGMQEYGFIMVNLIESPITGISGNKEFLGLFTPD